jgi:hypothetical protein
MLRMALELAEDMAAVYTIADEQTKARLQPSLLCEALC